MLKRVGLFAPTAALLDAAVKVDMNMLKDLRFKTEAPLKDCSDALKASNNDMAAAMEWLKKKGLNRAAGKKERVTDHGVMVTCLAPNQIGAFALQVCCETDFSAGNSRFLSTVDEIRAASYKLLEERAALYLEGPDEELIAEITKASSDAIGSCVHAIAENVVVKRIYKLQQPESFMEPETANAPILYGRYAHSTVLGTASDVGKTIGLVSVRRVDDSLPMPDVDDLAQHCVGNSGDSGELVHQSFRGGDLSVGKWLKAHGCKFASSLVVEFGKEPLITFPKVFVPGQKHQQNHQKKAEETQPATPTA